MLPIRLATPAAGAERTAAGWTKDGPGPEASCKRPGFGTAALDGGGRFRASPATFCPIFVAKGGAFRRGWSVRWPRETPEWSDPTVPTVGSGHPVNVPEKARHQASRGVFRPPTVELFAGGRSHLSPRGGRGP